MSGRAILAACVLVVAGCGGGGDGDGKPPSAADAVHEAAAAARGDTLRVKVTRSGNVEGLGYYGYGGDALIAGRNASTKGRIDAGDDKVPFEVRVHGEESWMSVSGLEKVPRGVRWLSLPSNRSIERGLAPYFLLDMFEKARDVKRVGEVRVAGAAATHYRATVPAAELGNVPEIVAMSQGGERVPVDLYVAEGRPKRLRLRYDTGQSDMYADVVVLGVTSERPAGPPLAAETMDVEELEK